MKALLIINPLSGGGKAARVLPKILSVFREEGLNADVYQTKRPLDAASAAKKATKKYGIVIAAGGDGTINEVANGLANSKSKMGIIPLGTENVLARELKIPKNPVNAARAITKGKTRRVDLGKANNRYFIIVAGVGFDAEVASDVKPVLKEMLGSAAYYITIIETLFKYNPSNLSITVDGEKEEGYFAIIGNSRYYGGGFQLTPQASIDDGLLDICIFKNKDVFNMLKYALGISAKRHTAFNDVCYRKAKEILIETKESPVLAHVDCEVIGTTPVRIKACPGALNVICP